jgi:allantoinase
MNNHIEGIYSRRCWIGGSLQEATVFFSEGRITTIEYGPLQNPQNVLHAGQHVLMPGVIDAHVHVNEPGRTDWEGFGTATAAAAAGGITTIMDMPLNASPVTTTSAAFRKKMEAGAGQLHIHCGLYGGLVPGNQEELEALLNEGVWGIKAFLTHSGIDEFPNVEEKELRAAMPLLQQKGIPLLVHCELDDGSENPDLLQHPRLYNAYLHSRPREWENKAIRLMIGLCRNYHCPVHIVHVSSSDILGEIHKAKKEGLPLTAETCPQYILFHAGIIPDGGTLYKCAPPIREKENNELLKKALANGTLDFIASDHSPAPPNLKETQTGNFRKAWGGIAGLQFLLPAAWTAMAGQMTLEKFIPLLTEHPARFLQLERKGKIAEGYDADLTIWSPENSFTVKEEMIFHKHKISPYVSQQLKGSVHQTFVSGELVYDNGRLVKKNTGKWLLKK